MSSDSHYRDFFGIVSLNKFHLAFSVIFKEFTAMSFPKSVTELLQNLIRIPSVNPDCAPDQGATGEEECARYIGELLQLCGAEVAFEYVEEKRPNVIGRFPGPDRKGVLLAPHVDTVSVKGMSIPPFDAFVAEEKIHGRGASDTKGTMAAMLWAIHQLGNQVSEMTRPLTFVGLMGEEAGQPGSKHFASKYADSYDFALIGEPTELKTVHAHKGCVWLKLTASGVSCHGSTPERGRNAIRALLDPLAQLLPWLEKELAQYHDDTLGFPTVNLGMIEGGSSPNIVPAHCFTTLDFRETPQLHSSGGSKKLVENWLEEQSLSGEIEVSIMGDSVPLLTDPGTDGIQRLSRIGSELTTAPWFCDAGRLAEQGVPAVACGPGKIAQAHTKDEFLAIKDLEEGAIFYETFLRTYLN